MPSLKKFCESLGWPPCRRWAEVVQKVKGLEKPALLAPDWPMEWKDRGAIRRFDDKKNYPAAGPGIVYDRQIALALGHTTVESVRNFHLYEDDAGNLPKDIMARDEYYSSFCIEANAVRIYNAIKRADEEAAQIKEQARIQKLKKKPASYYRRLRANAQTMVARFMVITNGHNYRLCQEVGVFAMSEAPVRAIMKRLDIRAIRLDNPERYAFDENGQRVIPDTLKFDAIHPDDIKKVVRELRKETKTSRINLTKAEKHAERVTIRWKPKQDNDWQHSDESSTYPLGMIRLALKHLPDGSGHLRAFGIVRPTEDLNGAVLEFEHNPGKERYEAELTPEAVQEILL